MKKFFLKPGFEFIFSFSIVVIFCLPLIVFAQNDKNVDVIIINKDTTINGKKLSAMSMTERGEALKQLPGLNGNQMDLRLHRNGLKRDTNLRRRFNMMADSGKMKGIENLLAYDNWRLLKIDTNGKQELTEMFGNERAKIQDHMPMMRYNMDEFRMPVVGRDKRGNDLFEMTAPRGRMAPPAEFNRPNSQNNSFNHIDKNGIRTRINISVADASKENIKKFGGAEGNSLDLEDLNMVPEFSSGKTTLLFSLPQNTAAEVTLKDSDGKVIFADKAVAATFYKSFNLPLNGIYYLSVKQAGKVCVKRIVKQ